jgi:WD40 repeat protein
MSSGREVSSVTGDLHGDAYLAYSPDGKWVVTEGDTGPASFVFANGTPVRSLTGVESLVNRVTFSTDGTRIASVGREVPLRICDVREGEGAIALIGGLEKSSSSGSVTFVTSKWLASWGDKSVRVWDIASGREILTLEGHRARINSVTFSPDGKRIASGGDDKTVKIWDAATGKELLTLTGHTNSVWSVAFSPDSKRIASGSIDKTIRVWDLSAK